MLTKRERLQLEHLAQSPKPLWGGHLQRGEPITDMVMQSWVELGLIEARGTEGYVISAKGREAIRQHAKMEQAPDENG